MISASPILERSLSQASAEESEGARQSPRGDRDPPCETLGPLGRAERLNWAKPKKRRQKYSSQCRISPRSYALRLASGKWTGQAPAAASRQACQARKAIFV